MKKYSEKGIGTYAEGEVHAALKRLYEPDETYHEVRCLGYIADVLHGNEIVEIQTKGFSGMRDKLDAFLSAYDVTVVYPVLRTKTVRWIDPSTGELSKPRKSPKKGTERDLLTELYGVAGFVNNDRFHLHVVLCDAEEIRSLDGWSRDKKKGSSRFSLSPVAIGDRLIYDNVSDLKTLIPPELPEEFTRKDLSKLLRLNGMRLSCALRSILSLGFAKQIGKQGRANLYRLTL